MEIATHGGFHRNRAKHHARQPKALGTFGHQGKADAGVHQGKHRQRRIHVLDETGINSGGTERTAQKLVKRTPAGIGIHDERLSIQIGNTDAFPRRARMPGRQCQDEGLADQTFFAEVRLDLQRVEALRKHLGDDVPLMVDVNQQWDRTTALRMGRALEQFNLAWIGEPLDAYDVEGPAMLSSRLDAPIGTGEMLTSEREAGEYIRHGAVDLIMHDAPRVGGITPFLKIANMAECRGMMMAPHFVMEIHLQLAAAYPHQTWVEHFEWLEPAFNERLEIRDGHMIVPERAGLGLTLSEQLGAWKVAEAEIGRRS